MGSPRLKLVGGFLCVEVVVGGQDAIAQDNCASISCNQQLSDLAPILGL